MEIKWTSSRKKSPIGELYVGETFIASDSTGKDILFMKMERINSTGDGELDTPWNAVNLDNGAVHAFPLATLVSPVVAKVEVSGL